MVEASLTAQDVDRGFEKVENFSFVQQKADLEELREAFGLLLLSLGMGEEAKERLYERVGAYVDDNDWWGGPFATGLVVVGIVIGLCIAQDD